MRRKLTKAMWLAIPGLWLACERDRPLGQAPTETAGTAGTSVGEAGSSAGGSDASTSGRGGGAGTQGTAAAGSAGALSAGGRAGSNGSETPGGAAGRECNDAPSEPFDVSHCDTPTFTMGDSTCSAEATRAALRCGEPGSQFDATCCYRTRCDEDAACGVEGRCLPRIVQAPAYDGLTGSLFEECSPTCDGCGCSGTDDLDFHGYCVNADEDVARFDCPVAGVACERLDSWRRRVADYIAEEFVDDHPEQEMQSCLNRIEDELFDRCGGCNDVPSEPFDVSHCDTPTFTMGDSTCSAEATRAALRCGEPGSQFDATCCQRKECAEDEDCGASNRCLPRVVQAPSDGDFGSFVEECTPVCDRCSCNATANVDVSGYCVDDREDLRRFDCPVAGVACEQLPSWRESVELHRDVAEEIEVVTNFAAMQSCLDRIEDELESRCEEP